MFWQSAVEYLSEFALKHRVQSRQVCCLLWFYDGCVFWMCKSFLQHFCNFDWFSVPLRSLCQKCLIGIKMTSEPQSRWFCTGISQLLMQWVKQILASDCVLFRMLLLTMHHSCNRRNCKRKYWRYILCCTKLPTRQIDRFTSVVIIHLLVLNRRPPISILCSNMKILTGKFYIQRWRCFGL